MRVLLMLLPLLASASAPVARAAGEVAARERLAALDRGGGASAAEVVRLTDRLLAVSPDDSTFLWRRGDALRRLGQDERALADLQRLIQRAPASPYAVRARRALPVLFLRLGLDREAARADEELLARELADPVAVLPRLARTYSRLGQAREVRKTVERLRAVDRERATADCDLAWLEADAIAQLEPPPAAAAAMLAFAARFPNDRRRGEALERASRAHRSLVLEGPPVAQERRPAVKPTRIRAIPPARSRPTTARGTRASPRAAAPPRREPSACASRRRASAA